MIEMRKIENESRKKREQEDKRKGEEMRQAAVEVSGGGGFPQEKL